MGTGNTYGSLCKRNTVSIEAIVKKTSDTRQLKYLVNIPPSPELNP